MFERFTDRARKVVALANQEAERFHHEYIGTDHLLLGLVKEGSGVGAAALKGLGIDLGEIRLRIERIMPAGPLDTPPVDKRPYTPRFKMVIELAAEEARLLHCNYVGTEHLLLGLVREHPTAAGMVLKNLSLELEAVRIEVKRILVG